MFEADAAQPNLAQFDSASFDSIYDPSFISPATSLNDPHFDDTGSMTVVNDPMTSQILYPMAHVQLASPLSVEQHLPISEQQMAAAPSSSKRNSWLFGSLFKKKN